MATLRKIIDDLQITASLNSDDSKVDKRSLEYWVGLKRSLLVRRELLQNAYINPSFLQVISCLDLESVDRNTSLCCNDLPIGCTILKSKLSIPKTIPYRGRYGITSIASPDILGKNIKLVEKKAFKKIGSGRHSSKDVFATILTHPDGDYIYVRTKSDVFQNLVGKYLRVELIAEDPTDLERFNNCSENAPDICFSVDMEYPLPEYLLDTAKQMVMQQDLQIALSTPEDNHNDASSQ